MSAPRPAGATRRRNRTARRPAPRHLLGVKAPATRITWRAARSGLCGGPPGSRAAPPGCRTCRRPHPPATPGVFSTPPDRSPASGRAPRPRCPPPGGTKTASVHPFATLRWCGPRNALMVITSAPCPRTPGRGVGSRSRDGRNTHAFHPYSLHVRGGGGRRGVRRTRCRCRGPDLTLDVPGGPAGRRLPRRPLGRLRRPRRPRRSRWLRPW